MEMNQLQIWCPNPACGTAISVMQYQKQVNCPRCGLQSCSQCKRAYHGEVECDDNPIFEPRRNNVNDLIVSDI